jgi:hypothetical protein
MAGSNAVLAAILLVDLVAFGLAIGAEQSRPSVRPPICAIPHPHPLLSKPPSSRRGLF